MRKRFEQQLSTNTIAISDIVIPLKCRDEMAAISSALKHIFITKELNEKIFSLLEEKILKGKKRTGRKGMDLWHILVLAVVRHACDTNWDKLHWMSNQDVMVRDLLGVPTRMDEYEFKYQSIIDNVSFLDDKLLFKINEIVAEAGQQMFKKKEFEPLHLKTDSYVLESNIHFPTDLNLLWDSGRKCLDTIAQLNERCLVKGARKLKSIKRALKAQFRATSYQVFKGKKEETKKEFVRTYLAQAKTLAKKCTAVLSLPLVGATLLDDLMIEALKKDLQKYMNYTLLFSDQIHRRVLKNEIIPASEKVFSIFEPHSEWITKGKLNKRVELGHLVLITTDQHHFIVDYKVMEQERDAAQIPDLVARLEAKYGDRPIASHSFDKGFYSKENQEYMVKSKVVLAIMPKKGKLNKEEKEREGSKQFKTMRNKHSAIESNINMLEHHGLNRCVDKGIHGFKRCVGLSVLAYNLHIMGNKLIAQEKNKLEKLLQKKQAA